MPFSYSMRAKEPFEGLFSPCAQPLTICAIFSGGAQVLWSASGMSFRFIGVSIIFGKIVTTVDETGISDRSAICSARAWVALFEIA